MPKARLVNWERLEQKHKAKAAADKMKSLGYVGPKKPKPWVAQVLVDEFTGVAQLGIIFDNPIHG